MEKVFYTILITASVSCGWLAADSIQLLRLGGSLDAVHENYHTNAQLLTWGVPVSFVLLLAVACLLDWRTNRSRYYILAGSFYVLMTALDYAVVCELYFRWIKTTGQWKGGFSGAWILAAVFTLTGMAATTGALWLTRTVKSLTKQGT